MTKIETPTSLLDRDDELREDELDAVSGGIFGFLGVVFRETRNNNIYSSEVDTGRRVQK